MHETPEDLVALRAVLEDSYASAGPHLLSIHTDNWRLSAEQIVERLTGMCIISFSTVNSKGEPIAGPLDGMFYRGRFWCGSARSSIRAQHIRRNPAVSLTHTVGEELAVTVHGRALDVDRTSERALGYRDYLISIYGKGMTDAHWNGDEVTYWEIEPRKMFALAPVIPAK
jgi:hypothetical protein